MTYSELLLKEEWSSRCNQILNRDHYTCRDCGKIGYHNGGNFMEFSSMEELNIFFKDWRIRGLSIKEFLECENNPIPLQQRISNFKFGKTDFKHNKYLANILLLGYRNLDMMITPAGLVAVCDEDPTEQNAELYFHNTTEITNISNSRFPQIDGSVFYLNFENTLTQSIFVTIEYNIKGYIEIDYPIKQIIDNWSINITTGNKFLSLVLYYSAAYDIIKGLNIHHNYYIQGKMPWEYNDDVLVTLCETCHKKRHETQSIVMYDSKLRKISDLRICDRCGGSGYLPQYNHVENGICFKCSGEGVVL